MLYKKNLQRTSEELKSQKISYLVSKAINQLRSDILETQSSLTREELKLQELRSQENLDFTAIVNCKANIVAYKNGLESLYEEGVILFDLKKETLEPLSVELD